MVSDMDDHSKMKGEIRDMIKWALENMAAKQDREVSAYIKMQCDDKYGPTWQCIVGEDFKAAFTCVREKACMRACPAAPFRLPLLYPTALR
jgi:hypothetical protein